ncbi:MAG TPA: serine/threonine-protein kinase, partial [Polyangia bacterium]|nr:serine/threonine-protein kinase [Polyangia bacterium]
MSSWTLRLNATSAGPPGLSQDLMGTVLGGRYRVGELLGKGGMARVHVATDLAFGRSCAVKIARGVEDCARLEREAEIGGRLVGPGLVRVQDWGHVPEVSLSYAVLDLLDGETLGQRLRQGRMSWGEAFRIGVAVAEALAALHAADVIHRDVKPDNVFLCRSGGVRLLDLGIAWAEGYPPLTGPGEVMGSVPYLPLEQVATPQEVDERADVYSLGLVLALAVGGEQALPRPATLDPGEFEAALRKRPRIGALVPELPEEVAGIIEWACEVDRERRYETVEAFGDALAGALRGQTAIEAARGRREVRRQRWWVAMGIVAVVGMGLGGGWALHRGMARVGGTGE